METTEVSTGSVQLGELVGPPNVTIATFSSPAVLRQLIQENADGGVEVHPA